MGRGFGLVQTMLLSINGVEHHVEVDADMPLVWVLRDHLGLLGTKLSCGMGLCGACTVHLDGAAARSCIVPVKEAVGHAIVTIEGLSKDGTHPVQQAWMRESVVQCGYCQSGFIMAAAALLAANSSPSERDIRDGLTNLCRCGTYVRIRKALLAAAQR